VTSQAELANLLTDGLALWGVAGRIVPEADGLRLRHAGADYTITAGRPPARWFLQTPARAAAGRGPRALPSITALLTALRAALGVPPGAKLRIGAGAGMTSA
jgi:hypothetical protein